MSRKFELCVTLLYRPRELMYRFSSLRVNDSLDGMLRACYTSEHRSCNRLRIRSLIICHRLHLPPLVVPFTRFRQTPLTTSREISHFVSDYLILMHGVYSREIELLLGTDVFVRDRLLEALGHGESATGFAIVTLTFHGSFLIFFLLALPIGRFLSAAILSFTAGP